MYVCVDMETSLSRLKWTKLVVQDLNARYLTACIKKDQIVTEAREQELNVLHKDQVFAILKTS